MTEELKERKNPCGDNKEIDEYLDGTMCEVVQGEEELNDIEASEDFDTDVDVKAEPEEIRDEYLGNSM